MYENLKFAPELDFVTTTNVQEATEVASKLTVMPHDLRLAELQINKDATVKNEKEYQITKYGFENLCKILGIPKPFARKIPVDLLYENIKRLQDEQPDLNISLLIRSDETVASIVKAPYSESSYLDVLSYFSDREDIRYINIGEQLLTICLSFEDTPISRDGEDLLYIGTYIYNSIVREVKLSMFSGLYRTKCENSLIAPFLGTFKANYLQESDIRLLRFVDNIRCYEEDIFNNLAKNFNRLNSRLVFQHEALKIWDNLNRIIGEADSDRVLKLVPEDRKVLQDSVKSWKSMNARARLAGQAISEPVLTEAVAYDVLNDVTTYAKALSGTERRDVEKLAGKFLGYLILN